MKKFKFSLQKLLEIREAREEEVKNELARVVSKQNRERMKQERLRNEIQVNQGKLQELIKKGTVTSKDVYLYENFFHISHRAIETAEDKIMSMEPEVNKVRAKLVEASKERKIVEKLRERKREEYEYHVNRETAKENDDINQNVFNRQFLDVN